MARGSCELFGGVKVHKLGKRQKAKFAEVCGGRLRACLLELGALDIKDGIDVPGKWRLKLATKGGGLLVWWWGIEAVGDRGSVAILCRFDDPQLAAKAIRSGDMARLNMHSGKWNFHYAEGCDPLSVALDFMAEIGLLLIK